MKKSEEYIRKKLFELRDEDYKQFNSKLIPTVNHELVIGVRTPALRKLAKEFSKDPMSAEFLKVLPHKYYEENNIHAFLIERFKSYDETISALDLFLPYVDNWATCDMLRPKIFKKHTDELLPKIKEWLKSDKTYTVRFAIGMLLSYYLDDNFSEDCLELVCSVKSQEYYINMMIAWYFATALAKQYTSAISYLETHRLDKWVHNKTIQKACESYRITAEQKQYLRKLKY